MRVQCPKCKRKNTYVTTDKYNPDITPHGGMVTLRNPKHKGGMTFGTVKGTSSIGAAFMECCDCGGKLVVGNRLIVLQEELPLPVDPVRAKNQAVINALFPDGEDVVASKSLIKRVEAMSEGPAPLTCTHCGKECKTQSGLVNHIRFSHGEK